MAAATTRKKGRRRYIHVVACTWHSGEIVESSWSTGGVPAAVPRTPPLAAKDAESARIRLALRLEVAFDAALQSNPVTLFAGR